jgi:hypothetical protein
MRRDGAVITYAHDGNNEELRERLEAIAEGLVLLNVVELTGGQYEDFKGLKGEGIRYENPRMSADGQRKSSLSDVLRRKRATCIEAAAIDAALYRVDEGVAARVRLVPEKYRDKVKRGYFHAVVELPNGEVVDSSESLIGYASPSVGHMPWWKKHGHCCGSCALGYECAGPAGGCDCGGNH